MAGNELGKAKYATVAHLEIGEAERALASYLEVDLAASDAVIVERVKIDAERGMRATLRIGLHLMAIKDRCEHGNFLERLADTGVGVRDAQVCMRLAKVFSAEGDDRRRQQLLDMGKTKATLLLSAKDEVREAVMSDPDLAQEVADGTKLDLLNLLKEKESLIERKDRAYRDLETQLETRSRELQKLTSLDPAALLTRSVRAEAVANAAALGEVCENLIRLGEAVEDESIAAEQRHLRRRAVGMAVGTALVHLQALYAAFEADLQDFPTPHALEDLTHEEKSLAQRCLAHMQAQFMHRTAQRRDEAYTEHLSEGGQKRRGRPPKKGGE